jgi:hypothetical protein
MSGAAAPALEVVVARHLEDPAWVKKVPRGVAVRLYDKGAGLDPAAFPRATLTPLPNQGREAHTYLTHLVTRYRELAPVTVFCQGRPFDHAADFHRVLRELAAGRRGVSDFQWLGFIIDTDDARGRRLFARWSKNPEGRELRLDPFFRKLFGEPAPERVRFYPGAQFALTAECARRRPVEFYQRALGLSTEYPDAAHCFERVWDRVFGVRGVDPALLQGQDTVYLKPIRRLGGRGGSSA